MAKVKWPGRKSIFDNLEEIEMRGIFSFSLRESFSLKSFHLFLLTACKVISSKLWACGGKAFPKFWKLPEMVPGISEK